MKANYILILFLLIRSTQSKAQQILYTPDILIGHRSIAYLHNVNYHFNEKYKINNLTLFDTEYQDDKNNIFFIRNTLSYNISNKIALNAAIGMKNPGSFCSVSAQYRLSKLNYSFSYLIGATYQKGVTLEQAISAEYFPNITDNLQVYFNLLAIANINLKEYQRGLQFIRLGLKEKKISHGLALNLDQFNNNKKTLRNLGVFAKYNF